MNDLGLRLVKPLSAKVFIFISYQIWTAYSYCYYFNNFLTYHEIIRVVNCCQPLPNHSLDQLWFGGGGGGITVNVIHTKSNIHWWLDLISFPAVSITCISPIEMIRTKMQSRKEFSYKGTVQLLIVVLGVFPFLYPWTHHNVSEDHFSCILQLNEAYRYLSSRNHLYVYSAKLVHYILCRYWPTNPINYQVVSCCCWWIALC